MRKALDTFYIATGAVAAIATVLIAVVVFVQVGARLFGVGVRGTDDLVAWLTASASLSGIGYAFTQNAHVRVDLLVSRLSRGPRHAVLVVAGVLASVIAAYAAYGCVGMVVDSFTMGDVSQGDIPVKLWIPQLGVAVGALGLAVAVLEHTVLLVLRGIEPVTSASPMASIQEI